MIFGITFKGMPETIDLRNSPSIELAKKLIKKNHKVKFYDVMYRELKKLKFKYSKYLTNNKNFMNSSDVIIVANYHPDYPKIIQPNLKFNNNKNNKLIFDCWNLLDHQTIQNLNWIYKNIQMNITLIASDNGLGHIKRLVYLSNILINQHNVSLMAPKNLVKKFKLNRNIKLQNFEMRINVKKNSYN